MQEFLQTNADLAAEKQVDGHPQYAYGKKELLPRFVSQRCVLSQYSIPPGKAAYPYHYHTRAEEVFYILSGSGVLQTAEGEHSVTAGDCLFFPANESGAHKLTNTSETQPLVYLDFDTVSGVDVTVYPESKKIGIWGSGINKVFREEDQVSYYDGE